MEQPRSIPADPRNLRNAAQNIRRELRKVYEDYIFRTGKEMSSYFPRPPSVGSDFTQMFKATAFAEIESRFRDCGCVISVPPPKNGYLALNKETRTFTTLWTSEDLAERIHMGHDC